MTLQSLRTKSIGALSFVFDGLMYFNNFAKESNRRIAVVSETELRILYQISNDRPVYPYPAFWQEKERTPPTDIPIWNLLITGQLRTVLSASHRETFYMNPPPPFHTYVPDYCCRHALDIHQELRGVTRR